MLPEKKRHGHTQERGPKGKRKQIEGKKSQDSLRHGSLAQWHASCKLIGESWAQEDVMVASVMARNGTGSTSMQYTHTHTLGSSSLDSDAINRMKVHRGILSVPNWRRNMQGCRKGTKRIFSEQMTNNSEKVRPILNSSSIIVDDAEPAARYGHA